MENTLGGQQRIIGFFPKLEVISIDKFFGKWYAKKKKR